MPQVFVFAKKSTKSDYSKLKKRLISEPLTEIQVIVRFIQVPEPS